MSEIPRTHLIQTDPTIALGERLAADEPQFHAAIAAAERHERRDGGRLDAGQLGGPVCQTRPLAAHTGFGRLEIRSGRRVREGRFNRQREHAASVESGVQVPEIAQRANEQRGAREQRQRQGHLDDHEQAAHPALRPRR